MGEKIRHRPGEEFLILRHHYDGQEPDGITCVIGMQ